MRDKYSFIALYEEHVDMVFNLSLNYVQNKEIAEELTQDVFLKVHDKLAGFSGSSSIKTWIYRIAINTALDHLKAAKAKKRYAKIFSIFHAETGLPMDIPVFDHPGIKLEEKEDLKRLFSKINTLAVNQRTALLLRATEDLSPPEIADIMQCSLKAVESLLSRARSALRKKMNESEG